MKFAEGKRYLTRCGAFVRIYKIDSVPGKGFAYNFINVEIEKFADGSIPEDTKPTYWLSPFGTNQHGDPPHQPHPHDLVREI